MILLRNKTLMNLLKFVKTAKYDSLMFKPIHIDTEQQNVIKIKYDRFVLTNFVSVFP